ncbi:hypothetical protein [Kangiella sp. TOML190]|uniref:hypothetical protein n=1 Tax=Kangiella sp. TOML190 TaxID=2931351 RepID=UPI002041CE68|nr:hypothetical protein [Kangiella sp. TOML190]
MKAIIFVILLLASSWSIGDTWCTGELNQLAVGRSGTVFVQGPGGLKGVYLCNLNLKNNNVEPEACKAMYSVLLAAKSQSREVSITFNPNIESCQSIPSWTWATNFNWAFMKD